MVDEEYIQDGDRPVAPVFPLAICTPTRDLYADWISTNEELIRAGAYAWALYVDG